MLSFAQLKMVAVAQLVRVLVCGAEGRGFEPHQPPILERSQCLKLRPFFIYIVREIFFPVILK